jgi:hypothetical protein
MESIHKLAYTSEYVLYIQIHSYKCIYIQILTYTSIYTSSAIYHSSFRLRKRDSVDCLHTQPILVANVDSREELDGRFDVRNGVQPVQDRVEFFSAEMAVQAVRRGEAESSDPIRVIIKDKMYQLIRQIFQMGITLRRWGSGSPLAAVQARSAMESPRFPDRPSLGEFQRNCTRRQCAAANAAAQTVCHAPSSLFGLVAIPIAACCKNIVRIRRCHRLF